MIRAFKHLLIAIIIFNFLVSMVIKSEACSEEDTEKVINTFLNKATRYSSEQFGFQEKNKTTLFNLPFELLVYVTSFVSDQKDLLRLGLSSVTFRRACLEAWKTRCLDLSRRTITKEDLNCITAGSYSDVNLEWTTICCEEISDFLLNINLHKLNLSHCKFSLPHRSSKLRLDDDEAKILARNTHIKILCLSWNQITSLGARTLALNSFIEDLDLYHNAIGAEGVEALLSNNTLKVLDLRRNSLLEGELDRLSAHPTNITKVQLRYFSK